MADFSNKGKMGERLKKIKLSKNDKFNLKKEEFKNDKIYSNFLKLMVAIPLFVYDNITIKDDNEKNDKLQKDDNGKNIKLFIGDKDKRNYQEKRDIIFNLDVKKIEKEQKTFSNRMTIQDNFKKTNIRNLQNYNQEEKRDFKDHKEENLKDNVVHTKIFELEEQKDKEHLEKKIINIIKKKLIKMVNDYEIYEGELFLLQNISGNDTIYEDCKEKIDEIKKLICKVDKLKHKYDFLKDNYDYEYMLELNDESLEDLIIELKNKFTNNSLIATVEDYKFLDLYKYLYLRIDKLDQQIYEYKEYEDEKLDHLKKRNIDFYKFSESVYDIETVNEKYISFVNEQNDKLDILSKNISKIDFRDVYSYKLKGFSDLLFSSFKYFGLLLMNPLKGFIPSIVSETLITKNIVSNLYKNLEWEEQVKREYSAIDYTSELNNAFGDLENTGKIVDTTLEDIVKLKIKYNNEFKRYQGDFSTYENTISKINDMENKILGNKIKIELMKKRYKELEKSNTNKLGLVKKLNSGF